MFWTTSKATVQLISLQQCNNVIMASCNKLGRRSIIRAARATTNNQPTNRAPIELARLIFAKNSQKYIFWGKNGRFCAKHPIYSGESKRHLLCIVFWVGHGTKWAGKTVFGYVAVLHISAIASRVLVL